MGTAPCNKRLGNSEAVELDPFSYGRNKYCPVGDTAQYSDQNKHDQGTVKHLFLDTQIFENLDYISTSHAVTKTIFPSFIWLK